MVKTWTDEEIEILKQNYIHCSKDEMLRLLPRHTWNGIRHKAERSGLYKRLYGDERKAGRVKKVAALYRQGKTLEEIASILGVSFATAQRDLVRAKIPTRPRAKEREGREFSEIEAAYIAGFFDGEGSVIIGKRMGRHNMQFANTNRRVLEWIKERVGGRIYTHGKLTPNGKERLTLTVHRKNDLIYLLQRINKYLIIKKKDAETLLSLLKDDAFIQRRPVKGAS